MKKKTRSVLFNVNYVQRQVSPTSRVTSHIITSSCRSNNLQRSLPMPTSVSHISFAMVNVLALSVVDCEFEPKPVKQMTLYVLLLR